MSASHREVNVNVRDSFAERDAQWAWTAVA